MIFLYISSYSLLIELEKAMEFKPPNWNDKYFAQFILP